MPNQSPPPSEPWLAAEASQIGLIELCQNPAAVALASSLANSDGFKADSLKTSLLWRKARRDLGADFDLAWANQHAFALSPILEWVNRKDGGSDQMRRLRLFITPLSFIESSPYHYNAACPVRIAPSPFFDQRGGCPESPVCLDRATQAQEFLPLLFKSGLRWSAPLQRAMDGDISHGKHDNGNALGGPIFLRAMELLLLANSLPPATLSGSRGPRV